MKTTTPLFIRKYLRKTSGLLLIAATLIACGPQPCVDETGHRCYSGIYPHLAYYNTSGECGTGAVVPWQDRLWVVTYAPHMPYGSDDKLYEITPDLEEITRDESIGGTPADRMIHLPSQQLFIGPYVIDSCRKVRVIPYSQAPGRPTGLAQHLTDPENRILYASMEAGFYDVDVHTLDVTELYKDGNQKRAEGFEGALCDLFPGYHGKGFYSGQGRAYYSNNGEEGELAQRQFDIPSGSLNEWDGQTWTTVRRCQFTEITGPGGITGNTDPDKDPIWALGWDYRSVILALREPAIGWSYYRLPKASYAYDGAHGWNTEWPRIRNVGTEERPDYLMTMHGMFWHFPETFSTAHSAGIHPRGAYLKVIADFTRWRDQLVFGCDDSAANEFLNRRKLKASISGPGQSNSNLWFGPTDLPDRVGPTTAGGSVWLRDDVRAEVPSDPFLFNGWDHRCAWVANHSDREAVITFEGDKEGCGVWTPLKEVTLAAHTSLFVPFAPSDDAVWIRATSSADIQADLTFVLAEKEQRTTSPDGIFRGLATTSRPADTGGLLYGLPNQRRALGIYATTTEGNPYYELDGDMQLVAKEDDEMAGFIHDRFQIPHDVVEVDKASVLIVDDKQRRWRLPLGDEAYTGLIDEARLRLCREVATERDLLSLHGTFYELPAENADGFAKVRPIASHSFVIHDYASYRGMMVLTGINRKGAAHNPHVVQSADGQMAVWAGAIDDLWKMGKPTGHGGPWYEEEVKRGVPSDPFLIGFYDQRELRLSHKGNAPVTFTLEADPTGDGQWFVYDRVEVAPGHTYRHRFPTAFQARWMRLTASEDVNATALFRYR